MLRLFCVFHHSTSDPKRSAHARFDMYFKPHLAQGASLMYFTIHLAPGVPLMRRWTCIGSSAHAPFALDSIT